MRLSILAFRNTMEVLHVLVANRLIGDLSPMVPDQCRVRQESQQMFQSLSFFLAYMTTLHCFALQNLLAIYGAGRGADYVQSKGFIAETVTVQHLVLWSAWRTVRGIPTVLRGLAWSFGWTITSTGQKSIVPAPCLHTVKMVRCQNERCIYPARTESLFWFVACLTMLHVCQLYCTSWKGNQPCLAVHKLLWKKELWCHCRLAFLSAGERLTAPCLWTLWLLAAFTQWSLWLVFIYQPCSCFK